MKSGNWYWASEIIVQNYERNFFVKTPWYQKNISDSLLITIILEVLY